MDDYGSATATNLKQCLDDVFVEKLALPAESYTKKMICAAADGAAVYKGESIDEKQ